MKPQRKFEAKLIDFYYRITETEAANPLDLRRGRLMSMNLLMCGVILLHITIASLIFPPKDINTFKEYITQELVSSVILCTLWVFNRKGYTLLVAHIFVSFAILTPTFVFTPRDLEATMVILALPITISSFVIAPSASFLYAFIAAAGYTISVLLNKMFYSYNFTSVLALFSISFAAFITAWQFNRSIEKNETLLDELEQSYETTLDSWSRALDMRDKETEGHTQRVAELTLQTAQKMGFSKEELIHIRRGALLHDIGKLGVPDSILLKPGPLTEEETRFMRKHTQFAYELIYPIEYLRPALDIPTTHHEKWDGTGYPRGLKGEEIPLAARIFAIADVYDALTSDRPYRAAWSKEKAIQYIQEQSGSHFDPQIVSIFLQELKNL